MSNSSTQRQNYQKLYEYKTTSKIKKFLSKDLLWFYEIPEEDDYDQNVQLKRIPGRLPLILHYICPSKPWNSEGDVCFSDLYKKKCNLETLLIFHDLMVKFVFALKK